MMNTAEMTCEYETLMLTEEAFLKMDREKERWEKIQTNTGDIVETNWVAVCNQTESKNALQEATYALLAALDDAIDVDWVMAKGDRQNYRVALMKGLKINMNGVGNKTAVMM
ncbi:hypothetical protein Poli38472_006838 [Pythium oligandrum]|uniref:Uncharacterized protein n=1 Tax=Pythium oligandrum TaxID=41045 RepID=A0A8K1C5T9_PYTOL|nr:hypothetical protein Poli38472_006838 [Pythium oligandrum]|eukprot:TMW56828.1 hypothetical protein Poli38472_006838 [Pythium oligandrum]